MSQISWQIYYQLIQIKKKIESQICQKEETHESNVNLLQKSCVSLESLFTRDDQTKNKNVTEESSLRKFQETQKINIGTFEASKVFKFGYQLY
jgi:hypothetical protein